MYAGLVAAAMTGGLEIRHVYRMYVHVSMCKNDVHVGINLTKINTGFAYGRSGNSRQIGTI